MAAVDRRGPASVRDRTPEFLVVVERVQKQLGGTVSGNGSTVSERKQQIQAHSEFARKAAELGHGIARTSQKLQKLAQLAKRTSMFDDPATEVDELTGLVKADIQALNNGISELQRLSARGREDSKQSLEHSHTVVDSLRTRLKDTTQIFKDVLTTRTENLKHHKERRGLFGADTESSMPLLPPRSQPGGSGHFGSSGLGSAGHDGGPLPSTALLHSTLSHQHSHNPHQQQQPPLPSFLQPQQQAQLTVAAPQDTYMARRAEALVQVESTIVELGSIFNKLSEMVAAQGEMVVRIDADIEDTLTNTTAAQAQLLKYFNSISSNRWLLMKVMGVLLIFMVLFIMFIA